MIKISEIYAELYFILEQIPISYIKLLPNDALVKLGQKMSIDHYNSYNKDKIFYKQKFNENTIVLLDKIYQKYWNISDI